MHSPTQIHNQCNQSWCHCECKKQQKARVGNTLFPVRSMFHSSRQHSISLTTARQFSLSTSVCTRVQLSSFSKSTERTREVVYIATSYTHKLPPTHAPMFLLDKSRYVASSGEQAAAFFRSYRRRENTSERRHILSHEKVSNLHVCRFYSSYV